MTLDDRGVRPLTARERRILARLERSLTGDGPVLSDPCTDERRTDERRADDRRTDERAGRRSDAARTGDVHPGARRAGGPGTDPGLDPGLDAGVDAGALHRADGVAGVIGLLILCGMTAVAAVAGGPVLGVAVGGAFLAMVVALVLVVRRPR